MSAIEGQDPRFELALLHALCPVFLYAPCPALPLARISQHGLGCPTTMTLAPPCPYNAPASCLPLVTTTSCSKTSPGRD